ncbi:unknown protein [Seminavis robusta]|uniref:Uncharacterized protein n=1 Tax=Seminavis robusta TaxID=568900 RepID=A0A9N8H6D2_9STRA|nr:unknown protein [Seminavis robusta]|eukprot:Sro41_g025270.1 n/a (353) ;mRNA; f:104338-105396
MGSLSWSVTTALVLIFLALVTLYMDLNLPDLVFSGSIIGGSDLNNGIMNGINNGIINGTCTDTKDTKDTKEVVLFNASGNAPELESLYFVHYQKVGSSLLTLLRNRIPSCTRKDWTCFGTRGGGVDAWMSRDGQDHFAFTPQSMNVSHLSERELDGMETCNDQFLNCKNESIFHCSYTNCKHIPNKVTIFRDPHKWFHSYVDFVWLYHAAKEKPDQAMYDSTTARRLVLPKQQQIEFTTGTNNVATALDILQHEYVFWGITDQWKTTVCLFHCELGGVPGESELRNVRNKAKLPFKTQDDIDATIPRPHQIVPSNSTQYIQKTLKDDLNLYHNHLMPLFQERAKRCNCINYM